MAQYQTFPDVAGDSRTLDKLRALKLPDLAGRRFLDVGCNEGFFCGFAHFQGASRCLGLDHSALFIERARQRFPGCEFRQQNWDDLPDEQFDVILLASALHYAEDQAGLIERLVRHLAPDGVLVLELGIVPSTGNEWVRVQRGIDEREFPTMSKLREILSDYAWKWMGRSVSQDGDPVARHVLHVSRRRPVAYLMLQPPGYGKSSIASRLFVPAGIPVVSGDEQTARIARGEIAAPRRLQEAVSLDFSPFRIDQVLHRVFAAGMGPDMIRLWVEEARGADFALDAYVPDTYQPLLVEIVTELGHLPVRLQWERTGPGPMPEAVSDDRAEAFYMSMAGPGAKRPPKMEAQREQLVRGFIDNLALVDESLVVRGWAVDSEGHLPKSMMVRTAGRAVVIESVKKQSRPDVRRHLGLSNDLVGFIAKVRVPGVSTLRDLAGEFSVVVPPFGRLQLTKRVIAQLRGASDQEGGRDERGIELP